MLPIVLHSPGLVHHVALSGRFSQSPCESPRMLNFLGTSTHSWWFFFIKPVEGTCFLVCSGNQTLCLDIQCFLANIFMIFAASHNNATFIAYFEVCSWHVAAKSRQISAMGILERLRLLRSDLRLRVYIWGKVWSNHVENQNPGNSDLHIGADLQWWICATRFSLEAVTEISLLHQNFQIWLLISETKVQMQPRLPPQS